MGIQPTKMVGIMGKYRVTYFHHPGDRGIVIDESKRGAARWMSASQAAFLPMIHLMEFRFRQGFNMVLEFAFSGKVHWEMLFKENIDHNFLGTSNIIQLLVKATRLSLSFLRWQKAILQISGGLAAAQSRRELEVASVWEAGNDHCEI
jgi:hypothetical protein